MDNKTDKKIYILLICEAFIIITFHLLNINNLYSFTMSTDELGYWGNAAFFLQKDWGNAVSYCPYYSYGYSIFLAFIMSLPISALMMYRLAIVCNALFMLVSFGISYYLFSRLFPESNKALISLSCMCMTLYASYVVQSSIAWSECYLIMFVWIVLLQGYLLSQKVTALRLTLFALELVYLYTIHQRTVGFLIAGIIYVILLVVKKKIKIRQLFLFFIILIEAFFISHHIKEALQILLYTRYSSGNDYAGIVETMTLRNLVIPAIREAAGQLYYLWVSSFGIIPLGIVTLILDLIKKWKRKENTGYYFFFVLLSFLGTLGVSSIFMRLSVSRVDYMIYGRYIEIGIGFFLIVGILKLQNFVKKKKSWLFLGIAFVVFWGLGIFLLNKVSSWNIPLNTYYQGACAAGMFWYYYLRGIRIIELCGIVTLVDVLLYVFVKLRCDKQWIIIVELLCMTIFWIFSGQLVIKKQIIPYQHMNNQDFLEKQEIMDYLQNMEGNLVFLSSPQNFEHGGSLQFYIENKPIAVIRDIKELDEFPDVLIVNNDESRITDDIIQKYYFACIIGTKSVYLLENINLCDTQYRLNNNTFTWNDIEQYEEGMVMYGPYISLQPGTYEVTLQMEDDSNTQDILGIADVASNGYQMASVQWKGESTLLTMQFSLNEVTTNIEFRYYKYAGNNSHPVWIELYKVD